MLSILLNAIVYGSEFPDYIKNVANYKTTIDSKNIQMEPWPYWDQYHSYTNQNSPQSNWLSPGPVKFRRDGSTTTKAEAYNQTGKMVSVYYTEWARYKVLRGAYSNVHPWNFAAGVNTQLVWDKEFNPEAVSHVQFGFVPICGDIKGDTRYQLALCTVNNCETMPSGKTSLQSMMIACRNLGPFEVVPFDIWGNFGASGQFFNMDATKQAYPDLKFIASVGGWTLSRMFYEMNDDTKIKTFANSLGKYAGTFRMFDGFDLDYEIPGGVGGADDGVTMVTYDPMDDDGKNIDSSRRVGPIPVPHAGDKEKDKIWFVKMVAEIRKVLDKLEEKLGKPYELTVASNCNVQATMPLTDFRGLEPYITGINMMTYDFSGAWTMGDTDITNRNGWITHQSNLYDRPDGISLSSVNAAYEYLTQHEGVPASKLAVGVAFYGRGWSGISRIPGKEVQRKSFTNDDNQPATGPDYFDGYTLATAGCRGTVQDGVLDFTAIKYGVNEAGCEYYYDECAEVPLLYCNSGGVTELFTYDNERSTFAKGAFVKEKGLRGLFAWTWDQDDGTLVNAMNESLGHTRKDGNDGQFGPYPARPSSCGGPTNAPPSPTDKPTDGPTPGYDAAKALKVYGERCGIVKNVGETINCPTGLEPSTFSADKDWVNACNLWFPNLIPTTQGVYPYDCKTAVANFKANHPNGCDCGMSDSA